jgi:hypothetical protein
LTGMSLGGSTTLQRPSYGQLTRISYIMNAYDSTSARSSRFKARTAAAGNNTVRSHRRGGPPAGNRLEHQRRRDLSTDRG